MTIQEATTLVDEYEKQGILPDGYTAELASAPDSIQGDEYKVMRIWHGDAVVISYVVKNGDVEDVTVVAR